MQEPDGCYAACVASITGIPLAEFPKAGRHDFSRAEWTEYHNAVIGKLKALGWWKAWLPAIYPPKGIAIAHGTSPRKPPRASSRSPSREGKGNDMKLSELEGLERQGGFRVAFEVRDNGMLRSDLCPEREEPACRTEQEAWALAERVARTGSHIVSVYVVHAKTFVPVEGYRGRMLKPYPCRACER
jgi:hypothetical protein